MLKKTIPIFILLMLFCKSGGNLDQPPTIRYGEDPCDECFMLINEARFAAAYVTSSGQTKRFDDIGCMLINHKKHQQNVAYFWVTDFNTHEWSKAKNAFYVVSDSIQTPMGFGIIAWKSDKETSNILSSGNSGRVLNFHQLLEKTKELYY